MNRPTPLRPQAKVEIVKQSRDILAFKGYPVQPAQLMRFDVTVRTESGFQTWTAIGRSSGDVMSDTLTHFGEQSVTIRVRREA